MISSFMVRYLFQLWAPSFIQVMTPVLVVLNLVLVGAGREREAAGGQVCLFRKTLGIVD